MLRPYSLLVCAYMLLFAMGSLRAEAPEQRVLCRRQLPQEREIVVAQQPLVEGAALHDLLGTKTPKGMVQSAFSLVVELHAPSQPPLLLFSRVFACWERSEYDRYEVLDLMVRPNQMVLVIADGRSDIDVVEIGELAHSRFIGLSSEWSLLGARVPTAPGRLSAKLSYNDYAQRVEIVVTDSLQGDKQHTLYHQKGQEWAFVFVKQWH